MSIESDAPKKNQRKAILSVDAVTLQYATQAHLVTAMLNASFDLYPGDRLVMLGPSGCGKSTLLKAVAGYLKPTAGKIRLHGKEITGPGPDRVMAFQEFDQLFPWKTVLTNVSFALTASGRMKRREADEVARHFLNKVNLDMFIHAYPHTLSGGMKQRVAIARCLAMNPEIILMDEPFAALDALTRQKMQDELLGLWNDFGFTMLFVTHSIQEALLLGNRILLISPHPGRIIAEVKVDPDLLRSTNNRRFHEISERIHNVLFKDVIDFSI
jgi:NitT/TauT family transport system ATP-binding protein